MHTKTIIKKTYGKVSAVSFNLGEALTDSLSPFDNFIQIIDGAAEVVIDGVSYQLQTGQAIIIPAHSYYIIKANMRFKMISTIINNGLEELCRA